MNLSTIQAWISLYASASAIAHDLLEEVKALAGRTLTPEENQAVLRQWDENVARSAANAGLPAPDSLPLTFVQQATRFADPVKRRTFAVERVQAALKIDRAHAEALVTAAEHIDAYDASHIPAAEPHQAVPRQAFRRGEPIASAPPAPPAKKTVAKKAPAVKKATPKKKAGKKR